MSQLSALLPELLALAFRGPCPAALAELIRPEAWEDHGLKFKGGPIFPMGEPEASGRFFWSGQGEEAWWRAQVTRLWPDPELERFLSLVPSHGRKMIEISRDDAVVYLDDLQELPHDLPSRAGAALMCMTYRPTSGRKEWITRHERPPMELLPEGLRRGVRALEGAGLGGIWPVRWVGEDPVSIMCVNEDRYRGVSLEPAARAVSTLWKDRRWSAFLDVCEAHGVQGYPDAIEWRLDGTAEVTGGVMTRSLGAR